MYVHMICIYVDMYVSSLITMNNYADGLIRRLHATNFNGEIYVPFPDFKRVE